MKHPRDLPLPSLKPGDKVVVVHPYAWLKANKTYIVEEVRKIDPSEGKEECFTFVKIEGDPYCHYLYRFALANDAPSLEDML